MEELKRCPHCGCNTVILKSEVSLFMDIAMEAMGPDSYLLEVIEDYHSEIHANLEGYRAFCCECYSMSGWSAIKSKAIEEWNERDEHFVAVHRKNGKIDYVKKGEMLC